jgi:hypothetical protein
MRALSKQGVNPLGLGTTMADDTKKTKADTAPKKDTAATAKSPAADTAKAEPKSEAGETPAKAPSDYSRGEGQKPVSAAYKENWNAIFAKRRTKKKSTRKKER